MTTRHCGDECMSARNSAEAGPARRTFAFLRKYTHAGQYLGLLAIAICLATALTHWGPFGLVALATCVPTAIYSFIRYAAQQRRLERQAAEHTSGADFRA